MKKLLALIIVSNLMFALTIKHNSLFIGASGGSLQIYDTENTASAKIGFYYYSPNIYQISNRLYIDSTYVDNSADFYITNFKIDWIKNNELFSPFAGLSYGYLYYDQNNVDLSTDVWGVQAGLLINLNKTFDLEFAASWQKAINKQDIWNKPLKEVSGGLIINF